MMSSILVPSLARDLAKKNLKSGFPAIFEKAINRFNHIEANKEAIDIIENSIARKKAEPSMAHQEERVWAYWGNFLNASRK